MNGDYDLLLYGEVHPQKKKKNQRGTFFSHRFSVKTVKSLCFIPYLLVTPSCPFPLRSGT